jgi:hypothetical protein
MSSGYHGWSYDEYEEPQREVRAQAPRRHPLRLVTLLLVGLALVGACI